MLYGSVSAQRRRFRAGVELARRSMIFGVELSSKMTAASARSVKISGTQTLHFKLPEGGGTHIHL
jgi:hypothetical protein